MLVALLVVFFIFTKNSSEQECGRALQGGRLTGKIVGGYDLGYYKYPWFAALLLDGTPWCGGTLIGPQTVITAAHCYKSYIIKGNELNKVFTVKLGIYKSCKKESTQKEFKVDKVFVHEKYLKNDPYFDIAVVTLKGSTQGYEPACLPEKPLDDDSRGMEGIIIGLGTIKYGTSKYPCNLQEGRVLIYTDKTCKEMIMNATNDKPDYNLRGAFCAGYMSGGVDACQGDSGGPLQVLGPNNRYIVVGATSFGYDCAQKDLLGIYTDVSHYVDWIERKTGVKAQSTATTPSVSPKPENTDFPVYPFTYPKTDKPPAIYDPNGQSFPFWPNASPPKRIIIEYHRGSKIRSPKTRNHKKYRGKRKMH